ncbi:SRPBCC family protein [Chryseobacterium sp. MIQD13]|uniref:SRPBCC family protein n=1 Tax=Chryseobacterium sp. MIQD13 TaxID=3422310 RepID=UPI003D2D53BF
MKFTNEIFIARSPEVTFHFVSDISNTPLWNYAVVETQMVSEVFAGVGTMYRQQRRFLNKTLEDTFVITEYEADRLLTLKSIEAEYPFLIRYSFKPSEHGTILINSFELHGRLFDNLLSILFEKKVKKAVAKNLGVLKELIERK